jgi:hypothetical protein
MALSNSFAKPMEYIEREFIVIKVIILMGCGIATN